MSYGGLDGCDRSQAHRHQTVRSAPRTVRLALAAGPRQARRELLDTGEHMLRYWRRHGMEELRGLADVMAEIVESLREQRGDAVSHGPT